MYLKRLELSGFKTFADRTTLEFGPGITTVVGPNGSGKSNLSDAIVWSLGEQSMKSLRSSSARDVIFTGSQSRKRAGVGEVSLTLDNSDGALPLEFAEVTITRRVFSTGEGEYYINRVPCRLRDIHELLLDTGIGKNAYSVISQNEIDRILSVRSEDRREIFEQAAGIQRYRQRKNEAGRKLDRVCSNLLRVNDIVHELETQVAPLAQQSEAAREYRRLSKELFDLKLSLLVHQHRALSENLARARDREVELDKEIETGRTRSHQLSAQEVEVRAQLQGVEEQLEEARGLVARLAGEADRAEGRVGLTEQRIGDLRAQSAATAEELARLEERLKAAREELAEAEQRRPELAQAARACEADIAAREEQLREQTGSLRTTGDTVEERRAQQLDTLRETADARNRLVQCESLLQAARARIARLEEQRSALQAKREEIAGRAAEAAGTAEELRQRRRGLQAEIYSLRSEAEAAERAQEKSMREELELRERLSGVRSRQRALEEMERSREGLRAGVRAVLAAVDAGRLPRSYRTVAELLQVSGEMALAIEAALGPASGDLVVPSQAEAASAIALLKETKGGRATFLPQGTVRPSSRPSNLAELARRPGCLGLAADLISCEPGYESIVEHLLGRVLVVEDLDAALAIARGTSGWRSVVTKDGDLVRPWGAITGGSPARSQLIGRLREIEELNAEQARLTAALERLGVGLREAQARAEAARTGAVEREGQLEPLAQALSEAEKKAEALAQGVRSEAEREEALAAEQAALSDEVSQVEQEREEAAGKVAALEERQRAVESAVSEFSNALQEGRDAREHLSNAAAELKVKLAALVGELRALDLRIEQLKDGLQVIEKGIADKHALNQRVEEARQQAEAGVEDLRAECQRLRAHHEQAERDLAATFSQRQELLDRLAANREEAAQNREELEALQGRLHRSQLRTTQLDSEINFTERTLLEEYRISLEEAEERAGPIENRSGAQARVKELQAAIDALGEVNLGAVEEYERVTQRLEFLTKQRADLEAAREDLQKAITEIDREATSRFLTAFELLQREFQQFFVRLFEGGHADFVLTDRENVLESGIDVNVTVPGKKTRDLLQLSGGERALTAAAILFALIKVRPSPFVILDEVDAPLDDSNVGRYCEVLREFAQRHQFIIITHNKGTMEASDVLYGVTMQEAGVSQLIGVRLRDPEEDQASPPPAAEVESPPAEVERSAVG